MYLFLLFEWNSESCQQKEKEMSRRLGYLILIVSGVVSAATTISNRNPNQLLFFHSYDGGRNIWHDTTIKEEKYVYMRWLVN